MTGRWFITGTDTGVGKTFVGAGIARWAKEAGLDVAALKPIETVIPGEIPDSEVLQIAAAMTRSNVRFRFAGEVAPGVAAQREGASVWLEELVAFVRSFEHSVVLVEGAGGWRVPIARDADVATLATALGFPVIAVGRAGLGTINHCVLTADAIRARGLELALVVINRRRDDDPGFAEENAAEIRRMCGATVVVAEDPSAVAQRLFAK